MGLSGAGESPATPTRVGLVACAGQKLDRPAPARDLYTSALFRKASAYATLTCERWYILSAKHGLIRPDTVIEPYNERLTGAHTHPRIQDWAQRVREQLTVELRDIPAASLVALAGSQYRTALEGGPWAWEAPMEGLGIGRQLGWLTAQLKALQPRS